MIPSPRGMDMHRWADTVVYDLSGRGTLPILTGSDWKNWAERVVNTLNIDNPYLKPYNYNSWQEWAERFVGVV